MKSNLKILYLEDDPKDADLVLAMLEAEGVTCRVTLVETKAAFVAGLDQEGIDLILADYSLPTFDGISALKIAVEKRPEVPFIFVSGAMGEEVAIEALKIGATDYVLKTRLSRILPAVQRALREGQARVERCCRRRSIAPERGLPGRRATLEPYGQLWLERAERRKLLVRRNLSHF